MEAALAEAALGRRRVEPNPLVGAVVVRDGHVLGKGHHARYGAEHAEVAALNAAGPAAGATLYVTLEPCSHRGKTPPCTEAVLSAGVSRVVYAASDPNPRTAGVGPARLKDAGVEVSSGLLADRAAALNVRYEAQLARDVPFTIAKWAMTVDGKIADVGGDSRTISGSDARRLVHEIRGAVDAVVVGAGTVTKDDPDLTARDAPPVRRAVRVVVDTGLRIPRSARVVATARSHPTLLACGEGAPAEAVDAFRRLGAEVVSCRETESGVDLRELFTVLKGRGIERVLLEAGGRLTSSALRQGLVHQVMAFVAPKLLGGAEAPTPVDGPGLARIAEPLLLTDFVVRSIGEDALLEGFVDGEDGR